MFSTLVLYTDPMRLKEKDSPLGESFSLITSVAGPGIAPGLRDYEPHVQLYTTPRD